MKTIIFITVYLAVTTFAEPCPSVTELVKNIYSDCLKNFKIVGCVQPKALSWMNQAVESNEVRITEDLSLIKKYDAEAEERRYLQKDVLDSFEDFLQTHDLVAKLPATLRSDGPYRMYIPRTIQPTEVSVPLAATGRSSSKIVKKVIFPFLLGLKFNTAILVPLALTLIALKTWKALTLGLLSLVLTGAIAIFSKFVAPKVPTYEVVHYPHLDHHHVDYHHLDVVPANVVPSPAVAYGHPVYAGRELGGQEMAYNSYLN